MKDGVNGRLVPPNDVPALAEALTLLVDDGPLRTELAQGAHRSAGASTWDGSIDLLAGALVDAIVPPSVAPGRSTSERSHRTP